MSVCDLPALATICDTVGQGAASLVSAPFDWLAQTSGQAAKWMFESVWSVFDSTTLVDVTRPEFVSVYNILFGVAIFVTLVFFCLQLLTGLVRRDPGALPRAGLGVAKSVLGSFLVLTLTATALEIVDQLCIGIVQATGTTMDEMGARIGVLAAGLIGINVVSPGVGAIVTIFLAGLAISATAILWFSLLVRKALLLIGIVMAPIALSGSSWDATRGWLGKWASFVLALIVSKFVIVVVFLVATAQISAPIDLDLTSISEPISGIVLMFVAAFAPYMAYKFISFMGFDIHHSMSAEQEAKSAMNRPVPMPNKSPSGEGAKKVLDGGSKGGSDKPVPPTTEPPISGAGLGPTGSTGTGLATASSAGAGAGAGGAASTAGAGAAGAAGPFGIAAVAGAKVAGTSAMAGPKLGQTIGGAADQLGNQAEIASAPPRQTRAQPTPPSSLALPTATPSPPTMASPQKKESKA